MKDLSRFSLEEKAGQLFILGFRGFEPDSETRAVLEAVRPGGIVLSQRNIAGFDQINRLTASFLDARDVSPLVAIHQEGGPADRLKQLFSPLPSLGDIADAGLTATRLAARIIASELESIGVTVNFAPCLDLRTGPVLRQRTFASSPGAVTRFAAAFLEEFETRSVVLCPKHFPGLGAADRDAHFVLPRIDKPKRILLLEDIAPFANVARQARMMMVGHGYYPALSGDRPTPASLSAKAIEGLLRRRLGFKGVIVTDDLTMGAVSSLGLTPELFLKAVEAGNDMLLFSEATPLAEQAFLKIVRTARESTIFRTRLDEKVARILALKRNIQPVMRNRGLLRSRAIRQIERLQRIAGTPQTLVLNS
jgi:beta-N-acetylhexosaminidase